MFEPTPGTVLTQSPFADLVDAPGGRLRDLVGAASYDRYFADSERLLDGGKYSPDDLIALGPYDATLLAAAGTRAQENGRLADARVLFYATIRAAEAGTPAGDPVPAAERTADDLAYAVAALGLGGIWVHEHRSSLARARVLELQRRALGRLAPDERLAVRLRTRLAAEDAYLSRDLPALLAVLDESRSAADPCLAADALSLAHHCLLGPEYADMRRALAGELMAVSAVTGRPLDALMGLVWSTVDLFLCGDSHAERSFRELQQRATTADLACIRFVVAAQETMLAVRAGRFDEAEQLAEQCRELGGQAGDADASGWYVAHLLTIRWLQGRGDEVLPVVSELVNSSELAEPNESFLSAVAAISAAARRDEDARMALRRVCGVHGLASLPRSSTWLVTLGGVIEAAYLLGDAPSAAEAYELLAPYADLPLVASLAVTCFGSAHRALGLAALTTGDPARAVRHLEAALDADLRFGHLPSHVLSTAALAHALQERADAGDPERAAALLDDAIERGRRLGLTGRVAAWEAMRRQPTGLGPAAEVRREGPRWRVAVGPRSVEVPHVVGMAYLSELVRNPGVELGALELASGHELGAELSGGPQAMLDEEALSCYRERIDSLRIELDDATSAGDSERATRLRVELDWLLDELARSTGLAGRPRQFGDCAERARTSVQKAIKRAIAHIEAADPVLGADVRRRVVTGTRCVYLGT
jgi:tetratricopeptide (TPR) repeat protein